MTLTAMRKTLAAAPLLLLPLAACGGGHNPPAPSPAAAASTPTDSCAALVGQDVLGDEHCTVPVTGDTAASRFNCDAKGGYFLYFRDGDRYVYGLIGGTWKQMQYTQSLGYIANDLGC